MGPKDQERPFEGRVVNLANDQEFADKLAAAIGLGCPVIVPYDVEITPDKGAPTNGSGASAHWATAIATYKDGDVIHVVYMSWGKYFQCPAMAMAASCNQLTTNAMKAMEKVEVVDNSKNPPSLSLRDYVDTTSPQLASAKTINHLSVKTIAAGPPNVEICDADSTRLGDIATLRTAGGLSDALLKKAGFDPAHLINAGLKSRFVLIYPANMALTFGSL